MLYDFFRIVFSKVLTFLNYIVSLNYYKFVIAFKNKIASIYVSFYRVLSRRDSSS